jgi:hypothetical protein
MRWLTGLISQLGHSPSHEELLQNAASLLATCAGTASAGTINRTFIFNTPDAVHRGHAQSDDDLSVRSSRTITVDLVDVPLDNHDYGSVGAQTWGSACIMADMIAENPLSFGIPCFSGMARNLSPSFRCLELGAGTGLVSLTVAKILELHLSNTMISEIELVPTDYYPAVLKNLKRNIRANFSESSRLNIQSHPLNWSVFSESDAVSDPAVLQKRFDVIYGADIVYEARHAEWIKACLMKLLREPDTVTEDPAFHLIIPLRKIHIAAHRDSGSPGIFLKGPASASISAAHFEIDAIRKLLCSPYYD